MNPKNDDNLEFHTSEQFTQDLRSLFEPRQKVRPEIDRAILDRASRQLHRRSHRRRLIHWPVYAAAAAAVIVFGFLLVDLNKPAHTPAPVVLKDDINRDGTVDILDAYKLARNIESTHPTDPQWDLNGDGLVDQRDVDTVAMAAVKVNEGVL